MKARTFLTFALVLCLSVAALAQTGPAVPAVDYTAGLEASKTGLATTLGAVVPILLTIAALFIGGRLVMGWMRKAAK